MSCFNKFKKKCNGKDVLRIAFRTNGGFGNVLIHANFINYFRKNFPLPNVHLTVYGHPVPEMTDTIFKNQNFVDAYYNYRDLSSCDYPNYDVVIEIYSFPEIIKADWKKIKNVSVELYDLLKAWKKFRDDERFSSYFALRPLLNSQIYKYSILNGKNCLNVADIDNLLGLPSEYTLDIKIDKDEDSYLNDLGLKRQKFITLQRGVNPFSGTTEAPKMWPVEHFNKLIVLLKKRYKDIKIVQLGESSERCKMLDGVDINLLGKTSWDDLKILLKNALYHIDGECGMVHLRKALNTGPSVVLFGPTPIDFFGYAGNINISTNKCSNCAGLFDNWQKRCLIKNAVCMQSITPELVVQEIDKYEHQKTQSSRLSLKDEIIQNDNIHLDSFWVESWFSKKEVYAYYIQEIKAKDLFVNILTQKGWQIMPILESPVLAYVRGDKQAYIDYMDFKNKKHLDGNENSIQRYQQLIEGLEKSYNPKSLVVVRGTNVILDGQHRACWLLNKYGPDHLIKVLKLYGDF